MAARSAALVRRRSGPTGATARWCCWSSPARARWSSPRPFRLSPASPHWRGAACSSKAARISKRSANSECWPWTRPAPSREGSPKVTGMQVMPGTTEAQMLRIAAALDHSLRASAGARHRRGSAGTGSSPSCPRPITARCPDAARRAWWTGIRISSAITASRMRWDSARRSWNRSSPPSSPAEPPLAIVGHLPHDGCKGEITRHHHHRRHAAPRGVQRARSASMRQASRKSSCSAATTSAPWMPSRGSPASTRRTATFCPSKRSSTSSASWPSIITSA